MGWVRLTPPSPPPPPQKERQREREKRRKKEKREKAINNYPTVCMTSKEIMVDNTTRQTDINILLCY